MICFSAIVPHTPLLVPTIGKEHTKKLQKTTDAFAHLEEELYAAKPDTIVIVSSHSIQHDDVFSLNVHDTFSIDFKDFGDLSVFDTLRCDTELASQIQYHMQKEGIAVTLDSKASLDYGAGVPLFFLAQNLKETPILPISYSRLSSKDHIQFGVQLKEVFEQSKKRIAIIVSGDLSHCLSSDAPIGFKPEGKIYDEKIVEATKNFSTSTLLSMSNDLIENAHACIHEQLLILFGILEKKNVKTEILSYQHPFGVGYLVAQIHL